MKPRILLVLVITIIALTSAIPSLASDTSTANYYGIITVSNNGTLASNVATVFTGNTTAWAANNIMNTSGNNTSIVTASGSDVAYMPGHGPSGNPWCLWVPSIGANTYSTDILYTGGTSDMNGKIRYFPDSTGMTTSDAAGLEYGDNFTYEYSGFVDTTQTSSNISVKAGALDLYVGVISGNITASMAGPTGWESPTSHNDPDTEWSDEANVYDDDTGTKATESIASTSWSSYIELYYPYSFEIDSIRYYTSEETGGTIQQIDVDYWLNGSWADYYQNTVTHGSWQTLSEGTVSMSGVRMRFYNANVAVKEAYLHEIDVNGTGSYIASVTETSISSGEHDITVGFDNPFLGMVINDALILPNTDNLVVNNPMVQTECSGSPFDTIDDNAYSETVTNATWASKNGYTFDGAGDYITSESYSINYNNYTFIAWIYPTNMDDEQCIYSPSNTANQMLIAIGDDVVIPGNVNCITVFNPGVNLEAATIDNSLSENTWQMIAISKPSSATVPSIYIDGVLQSLQNSNAQNYSSVTSTAKVLGRRTAGNYEYEGRLGWHLEYDIALSESEIQTIYDATKSWFTTGDIYIYSTTASVPDNSNDWVDGGDATPYIESVKRYVGGVEKQHIEWEYDTTFSDLSGNSNDATPSFRSASTDAEVSAVLSWFLPVSEAQAPAYTLTSAPDFFNETPGVSSNFTIDVSPTYPGRDVISAVAIKGVVPETLPTVIFSTFVLIVISLAMSYMMKSVGTNSLFIKTIVITAVMCVYAALQIYDVWQVYFFVLPALALCWLSRQREAY